MKQFLFFFRNVTCTLLLLFCGTLYAQLPDFTLQATPIPQTCLGNGSITFAVSGINPAAEMAFEIYLLPNTTIPVATVNSLNAGNLIAGNYLVIATQTLGSESNTATVNVNIPDNTIPLVYTITPAAGCDGIGSLVINVASGTAVTYEIIAGPVTKPQQDFNIFTGMPPGQYTVRVYNNCGDAVVVTTQVVETNFAEIILQDGFLTRLISCDVARALNIFSVVNGTEVALPFTCEYTVYPPGGGAPTIITKIVNTISSTIPTLDADIPYYNDQDYYYNLKVTDACGTVFTINNNQVQGNQSLRVFYGAALSSPTQCFIDTMSIETEFMFPPFTVTFENAPPGFNPVVYNPTHPVFNESIRYSTQGENLPFGDYSATVTDACGRSANLSWTVEDIREIAIVAISSACMGYIQIDSIGDAVVAEVTAAPETYPYPLPHNLMTNPGNHNFFAINDLLPGSYTIHIIDECGNEKTEAVAINSQPNQLNVSQGPGCTENYGSLRLRLSQGLLNTIQITEAPAGFSQTLPLDVSENISQDGVFYMNTLPEGDYTFIYTVVNCDGSFTRQAQVTGYQNQSSGYTLTQNCNSFDLSLNYVDNNFTQEIFWLQKYDEATGTWVHPLTGNAYQEGSVPEEVNSAMLNSNTMNYSLPYSGKLRLVRVFYTYGNGLPSSPCVSVADELTVIESLQINNAYSFPCDDGTAEILVDAVGVAPLTYSITQKNGQPFGIINGTSAFFHQLEPAIYNFMVTDVCGNIRNIIFDINTLEPMEIEPFGFCDGQNSSLTVPDFPFLVYQWYKQSSPGTILSTTNELLFPAFDPDTDTGIYLVHIEATTPGSCIDLTVQYQVIPNGLPNAGNDDTISMCGGGGAINLEDYLGAHDAGGMWEDVNTAGSLSGGILDTSGLSRGDYQFQYIVTSACGIEDLAIITLQVKEQPAMPVLSLLAPVCEGTDVQLSATAVPGAVYEWTGPGGFSSAEQNPLIANAGAANAGTYSLTVTVNGCPSAPATVVVAVNPAPQFTIDGNATICAGQSTLLSVVPGNFPADSVAYKWYKDGTLQTEVTDRNVEIFEPGIYKVEVDNNGCLASKEIEVTINENAFALVLEAGCLNEDYILAVANSDTTPGASFSWTGPQGFSALGSTANISGLPGGDYHVTAVNAEGCTAQATIAVDSTLCGIPRGISPNGDQYNQTFDLSNLDTKKLIIFNRYGEKVYEKENYKDEWFGQSDKGDLPTGTYFYVVTLSEGKQVTGWVYLQREVN